MATVNGQEISNKYGGGIVFANNFTVNTNTPLDVRLTKTTKSELLDPTSWVRNSNGQYLVYTGMLVVVTSDTTASNNGIWEYIGPDDVANANPTLEENWVHLISGETSNTTINGSTGAFTLGNGLQLGGTGNKVISAKGTGYITTDANGIKIDTSKISDIGTGTGHDNLATKGYVDHTIASSLASSVKYGGAIPANQFKGQNVNNKEHGLMYKIITSDRVCLFPRDIQSQLSEASIREFNVVVKAGDVVIYNANEVLNLTDKNNEPIQVKGVWQHIPSADDVEYTGIKVGDTTVIGATTGGDATFAADNTLLTVAANGTTITYSPTAALTTAVTKANSALQSVIGDSNTLDGRESLDGNKEYVNVKTTIKENNEIKVQSELVVGSVEGALAIDKENPDHNLVWKFMGVLTKTNTDVEILAGDIVDIYGSEFDDYKGGMDSILIDGVQTDQPPVDFVIPVGTKTVGYNTIEDGDLNASIGELPTGLKLSFLYDKDEQVSISTLIEGLTEKAKAGKIQGQVSQDGIAIWRLVDLENPERHYGVATAQDVRSFYERHKAVVYGSNNVSVTHTSEQDGEKYGVDLVWLETI